MIEYTRTAEDGCLHSVANNEEAQPFLRILNIEECKENQEEFPHYKELLHSIGSIRYCKAEVFRDCILGTLRIPQKTESRHPQLTFAFCITEQSLWFMEDTGDLKQWVEKEIDRMQEIHSPEQFFLQMLEQMIENDTLYLSHLEKELEDMEDALAEKVANDFFTTLTKYRQKLSELNAYYEQLTAIGDLFQSQDSVSFIKNTEQWGRYALRTERLQNHVHLLRENTLQLRELYQSQQDAQQNKVMCILTVVTTLFLPLTLLTGWYGMNFVNMPELRWKYGYAAVIVTAILVVLLEIVYFKKKKLL